MHNVREGTLKGSLSYISFGDGPPLVVFPGGLWASYLLVIAGCLSGPIAIGIAILRYRLYEIDTLINRTLVYGTLTAALVALYFGVIVVFQRMFVLLTGQQSTLAVVASTLLIAALFNPLRRRIQSIIDRRFYTAASTMRERLLRASLQS